MIAMILSSVENEETRSKAERIYLAYGRFMLHVASKYLPEDKREDALQEAMLRIIKNIGLVDCTNEVKCRSFCAAVVRNVSIDMLRKDGKICALEDADEMTDGVSTEERVIEKDEAGRAVKAILSLNDTYRNVCYLKYVNGLKEKEIAKVLGIGEKAVSLRIYRGKQIIRKALEKEDE